MSSLSYDPLYLDEILQEQYDVAKSYVEAEKNYPDFKKEKEDSTSDELVAILSINDDAHHGMVYLFPKQQFFTLLQQENIAFGPLEVEASRFKTVQMGAAVAYRFHIVLSDENKYFLSQKQLGQYKEWATKCKRHFYCGATKLSLNELNQLAIMVAADRYILTQKDCLEFAKEFCRRIAVHENDANEKRDLGFLKNITVFNKCGYRELEWSSRQNISGAGFSIGFSYASVRRSSDQSEKTGR